MYRAFSSRPSALASPSAPQAQHKTVHRFYSLLAIAAILAICALPSMAATDTVTSLLDDGSSGTLRSVMLAAAPGDTIAFSVTGTITLDCSRGVLDINKNLTISGPGAASLAISGANTCRVFQIDSGVTAIISGVTVQNGSARDFGGGAYNSGTLTVSNSTVSGNSASCSGGGIYNNGSTLTVSNSTLSGNSASGDCAGGGIYSSGGTVTLNNSTLSGNAATGYGAGGGILDYGTLTLSNSTLSGNSAAYGGGIINYGTATLSNSTLSGNSGSNLGGGIFNNGGTLMVKSTIVANSPSGGDCEGSATSAGYNLSDDTTCSFLTATGDQPNTPAGLDPGGLKNNGGPTQTIALLSTSPAVDAVPVSTCTDANGNSVTTDQRGITRPQGAACDVGAFELVQSVAFATFSAKLTITTAPPPGFTLNSGFTLGAQSNGINPASEAVTLRIGTNYSVTFPAGSFKVSKKGVYTFSGTINGTSYAAQIALVTTNSYTFKVTASGANGLPSSNPVSVTLTIGNDTGTTSTKASFQ